MTFRNTIFLIILSASFHCFANDVSEVSNKNYPEFQNSAFIKLMNSLNSGQIPYPFEKLLDSFGTGTREDGLVLFVPEGRSLVKNHADFKNPRIITDPLSSAHNIKGELSDSEKVWAKNKDKFKEMGIREGDLFIGLAPNHKALEIISYNPSKSGYDFFIVENYEEGKKPKIISSPSRCISCHQNGGPIFPRFPWREFVGHSTNGIAVPPSNELLDKIKAANKDRTSIEGFNFKELDASRLSIAQAGNYDFRVREGNRLLLGSKVCESICDKNSFDCQKDLILQSLKSDKNIPNLKKFKDFEKNIHEIKLASSVIPDRNPYTNEGFKISLGPDSTNSIFGTEDSKKRFQEDFKDYDPSYEEGPGFFNTIETVSTDKSLIDPSTIRPPNTQLILLQKELRDAPTVEAKFNVAMSACLPTEELRNIDSKNKITEELLNRPAVKSALKMWPHTRELPQVLEAEAKKVSQNLSGEDCSPPGTNVLPVYVYDDILQPVKMLLTEKVTEPKDLFIKYCVQCHGGTSPIIKLPLDQPEMLSSYKPTLGDKGPLQKLEMNLMPPAFAPAFPTDEERQKMIDYVKDTKIKN